MAKHVKKINKCRICKSNTLSTFLPLGDIPLPNGFLTEEDVHKKEAYYPLTTGICTTCGLAQLMETVDPEVMFRNYVYIPSTSKTRMKNFESIAQDANQLANLSSDSLIIDIGSNDGSLLSFFKGYGMKVLGIDPAINLAKIAELKGIETVNDYITPELAKKIRKTRGPAQIITATNVVAHIDDLHGLLKSIEILLADDGIFICEFPYFLDLIENNQFDTIYHEHLSYFAIKPLINLIAQTQLEFLDIRRTEIDGGSLRVFLQKRQSDSDGKLPPKVKRLLEKEKSAGLDDVKTLKLFAKRVKELRIDLKKTLTDLKAKKKTIAAYGAAAKGNILLNYCNITHKLIDFAVDSTPYKQGLYMPGTHIRIYPESEIMNRKPDYILILAWNFAREIMEKERKYTSMGGKFIIPVPKVTIIGQ